VCQPAAPGAPSAVVALRRSAKSLRSSTNISTTAAARASMSNAVRAGITAAVHTVGPGSPAARSSKVPRRAMMRRVAASTGSGDGGAPTRRR
jgi:hypothetical protein